MWDKFKHPNNICVIGAPEREEGRNRRNLEKVRQNIFEFDENYKHKHSRSSINPKHKK